MIGANRVFLIGEVADIKPMGGNKALSLKVKVTEQWIDRSTGEVRHKAGNHKVVLFGEQKVTHLAGALKVGDAVLVEGKLENRSWENQQGVKQWETQVAAQDVTPLQAQAERPAAPRVQAPQAAGVSDDDLPF